MRRIVLVLMAAALICLPAGAADFTGDGTGDIAIFRPDSGLWAVRGVTRIYFGGTGDIPVPGDYSGSGTDAAAIFRASSGLWAVQGVTRVYFGGAADQVRPGDYNGDGTSDFGIFRPGSGLWAVRGVTRFYFGTSDDIAIDPGPPRRGRGGGLLQTGQTESYRDGDDGDYQKGIAFSYQTLDPAGNGEIVTVDNVTGLMWASDGNAAGCNDGGRLNWEDAIDWAKNLTFAGYSDWRLPNRRELESIVDSGRNFPSINTTYFPNTVSGDYWSGSTSASNTALAWVVYFDSGGVLNRNKTGTLFARAVRGGE